MLSVLMVSFWYVVIAFKIRQFKPGLAYFCVFQLNRIKRKQSQNSRKKNAIRQKLANVHMSLR